MFEIAWRAGTQGEVSFVVAEIETPTGNRYTAGYVILLKYLNLRVLKYPSLKEYGIKNNRY